MTEYYMLISQSMWDTAPAFAIETFRTNLSRHGIVGDIQFRAETNWVTGEKTGMCALIADVQQ